MGTACLEFDKYSRVRRGSLLILQQLLLESVSPTPSSSFPTYAQNLLSNQSTACSDHTATVYNEYCQNQIFGIDQGGAANQKYAGSTVFVYGLNTVGAVSMVDRNGASAASEKANTNSFASSIIRFVSKVPGT